MRRFLVLTCTVALVVVLAMGCEGLRKLGVLCASVGAHAVGRMPEQTASSNAARLVVQTGHTSSVLSVAFGPDGRRALTGSYDNTALLWDLETGKELCALISFDDDTWVVRSPDGGYDSTNGGDTPHVHFVRGMEVIPLQQLKDQYYEPGLLAHILGYKR